MRLRIGNFTSYNQLPDHTGSELPGWNHQAQAHWRTQLTMIRLILYLGKCCMSAKWDPVLCSDIPGGDRRAGSIGWPKEFPITES
jgi:hypothetical protein